jgi:ABC-type transport system involved in multi-copper enzyme maturation permease subunit
MNLPAALFVVRSLARDTFRQSLAGRTFWLLLGLSGLVVLLCLSVRVEGYTAQTPKGEIELYGSDGKPFTGLNPTSGRMSVGFGAVQLTQFRDGPSMVHFLQSLFAKCSPLGVLLLLLWSSGFLPDFLRPESASVLLAKPAPRWALLVGKYLGVLLFVAVQVGVFVFGTWLALGVRTGCWNAGYLWLAPLVLLQFAVLYSFAALIAVWVRNPVVSVLGALLLWGVCAAVNDGRHELAARGDGAGGPAVAALAEAGYWLLPKPGDLGYLQDRAIDSSRHFGTHPTLPLLQQRNAFAPELSLLTSLLFTAGVLALAGHRFVRTDY